MATAKKKTDTADRAPRARRPTKLGEPSAPLYKVRSQSFIDNHLVGPGTPHLTVTYWGVPGKELIPLNAAAKANKLAAKEVRDENKDPEERREAMRVLDNELQNHTPREDDFGDDDLELSDAERKELESHAAQTQKDQEAQDKLDGANRTGVILTGNPADPEGKAAAALAAAEAAAKGKKAE